jgi:hypothetical protein
VNHEWSGDEESDGSWWSDSDSDSDNDESLTEFEGDELKENLKNLKSKLDGLLQDLLGYERIMVQRPLKEWRSIESNQMLG